METAFRSDERFTQREFFDWLQERPRGDIHRYELLGGHIVMTPPAGFPGSPIGLRIGAAILRHVSPAKLGTVCESSAGFDLPSGDTVQPDVTFISAATLAAAPKTEIGRNFQLVPDLVVEVLSRSTARRDRNEKRLIYERNGVHEYWIVAPETKRVSVYRLTRSGFTKPVTVMSGAVESSALPGLVIPLAEIFADCD